jgi:AcrR family transcriptional regulator
MIETRNAAARVEDEPADGRRLRGERSRAHILEQSILLASVEGLEGITFGRVASDAGVGKANIQVLFGNRENLQLATLESAAALYRQQVSEPALRKRTPLARLRALVEGWYAFVQKRELPGGCFVSAVSSEFRARPGVIQDRVNQQRAEKRGRFRGVIQDAVQQGQLRAGLDAEQLIFDLLACEAAANVASLLGDDEDFARARRTALARIEAARS